MTGQELLRLIGEIEDQHIELSLEDVRKSIRRRAVIKWTSVAASVAILVGVAMGWNRMKTVSPPLAPPSAAVTTTDTPAQMEVPTHPLRYPDENEACYLDDAYGWGGIEYYDYAELANKSDMVLVVDVISQHRIWYRDRYQLYSTVVVRDVIAGAEMWRGAVLNVHDNGTGFGKSTGEYMGSHTACGGPLMEQGNKLLLFLQSDSQFTTPDGELLYEFAVPEIGKFFYDRDGRFHSSATYCDQYPDRYMTSSMLEDYTPKTLEEIKRLIQAVQ